MKIVGLLIMALYILVADVVSPLIKSTTGSPRNNIEATVNYDSQRISKLEAIVERLVDIPSAVSAQTEAINNLKSSVDKMDTKLERHLGK